MNDELEYCPHCRVQHSSYCCYQSKMSKRLEAAEAVCRSYGFWRHTAAFTQDEARTKVALDTAWYTHRALAEGEEARGDV